MSNFWMPILIAVARRAIDRELWDQVVLRVTQASDLADKPGEDKQKWVAEQIQWGTTWLMNLTIEIVVASMKISK